MKDGRGVRMIADLHDCAVTKRRETRAPVPARKPHRLVGLALLRGRCRECLRVAVVKRLTALVDALSITENAERQSVGGAAENAVASVTSP